MKIGIDYSLATATNRGMGRYIREIVNCLMESDTQNHYILYTHYPTPQGMPANFEQKIIPISNEIIAEQWYLPRMALRDKVDVLWCPANTFPMCLNRNIRLVVTIHDLIFMNKIDGKSSFRQKIGKNYRKWVVKMGRKRIDGCLTVSQYSKCEIEECLGIKDVGVTYNRIDAFYKLAQNIEVSKERKDFYFTVSGDAPSKNLKFLIDTFIENFPDKELVIAGLPATSVFRKQQAPNIRFLQANISDIELIERYKLCEAFIFVSLQEGFGIPALEAIVCDAPIICSDRTSLPEVVGKFGILIDPTDRQSLVTAIDDIALFDSDISEKQLHLKKFLHWSDSAEIVKQYFV